MAAPIIRRAVFYVPSYPKMLRKSLVVHSDNVTFDLEDSVPATEKDAARSRLVAHLESLGERPLQQEVAVRTNPLTSPHFEQDISAVAQNRHVDALLIPKVDSSKDLQRVAEAVSRAMSSPTSSSGSEGRTAPLRLMIMIESARAVMDLREICTTELSDPRLGLSGLVFGAEDFAADLSLTRTPGLTELLFARSAIVTAARAFRIPSAIDLVCTNVGRDTGGDDLTRECLEGRRMGFTGKQAIHPMQLPEVFSHFGVSKSQATWAVMLLSHAKAVAAAGRGSFKFYGKMVDGPIIKQAELTLEEAERLGVDVAALREKYEDWVYAESDTEMMSSKTPSCVNEPEERWLS